ncbi:hypothetical protein MPH_01221 [Macrophomina phaseolina MS6]|uniref:Uncharacterized protein n=1 Tax=Macrophomina phaseolina (strain MS6) TaxID=1126212 RepID=K2S3A0_MACPH|nr:hypothetical protein MPH_01221 [Macrophomina phaseolina MS6]
MTLDLLSTVCSGKRETRRATEVQTQDFSATSILMHEDEHHVGYDCQATIAQEEIMLLDDLPGKVADATLSTEDELLHSNTSTSVPQRIDSGTAFMDDQLSKGDAALHELRRASPERILELVDSALRLAICEKPLRLPFGIKLTRDNVTRLASVAPALWRAHHLRAVSERSPLIPTIAHALSHSVIANARSDPLKRKAAELLDHYKPADNRTGPLSPDDAQQRRDPDFVYEAVSIGLWDLLQRSHFDSGANSRLKPLKTRPRDIDAKDLNDNDEMLYGNNSQFLLDLNPLVNEGGSANSIPSFQDHKRKDLLWEWNDEYQDTRTDSARPTSMAPFGNRARPEIFDMGKTDQVMPLDWDEEVHFDPNTASGNTFEAQDPSSKTNTHVSESFCGIDAGVSFEAKDPIETYISTDACDNLAAVSEMIFN